MTTDDYRRLAEEALADVRLATFCPTCEAPCSRIETDQGIELAAFNIGTREPALARAVLALIEENRRLAAQIQMATPRQGAGLSFVERVFGPMRPWP